MEDQRMSSSHEWPEYPLVFLLAQVEIDKAKPKVKEAATSGVAAPVPPRPARG
jgi:hypothetical protein